jgi:tripartite-type tricarboxylate transporter receptor subunit TctC
MTLWLNKRRRLLAGAALAAAVACGPATAAKYPDHPVTIIVPIAAGGTDDLIARMAAQHLSQALGQGFIADNRPGGGNTIGGGMVARAAPDGYTLLLTDVSNTISESLHKHLSYDSASAFKQVSLLATTPYILVVNPQLGVKDVKGLIALAKAHPGKLTYASAGVGTGSHLAGALFAMQADIDVTHVPYKGGGPALNDLLGNHVDMLFVAAPSAISLVKSGRLLALMSSDANQRSAAYPDTPTSREAGLKDYSVYDWFGLSAPKGTPQPVVRALNAELNKMLALPDVKAKFAEQALVPTPMSPDAFEAFYQKDIKLWAKVVEASHTPTD